MTIAVLNGPNLNLLGEREPHIYGHDTLTQVEELCRGTASESGLQVEFQQSNHEGVLVDAIQELRTEVAGIVINPAALAHTSVAIHDALEVVDVPVVEVHISNVHRREQWRHHSYVSMVADAVIMGCGIEGYALAIRRIAGLAARDSA